MVASQQLLGRRSGSFPTTAQEEEWEAPSPPRGKLLRFPNSRFGLALRKYAFSLLRLFKILNFLVLTKDLVFCG